MTAFALRAVIAAFRFDLYDDIADISKWGIEKPGHGDFLSEHLNSFKLYIYIYIYKGSSLSWLRNTTDYIYKTDFIYI